MYKLRFLLYLLILPLLLQSCKDEDEINQADLIGIWTVNSTDVAIFANDIELTKYLIEEAGYTATQAAISEAIAIGIYEAVYANATIEFKNDNTFLINIPNEDDETGSWSLNSSSGVLTIEGGTIDETDVIVRSLNSNNLVLEFQLEEQSDIDEDNTPEKLNINSKLSLSK